MDKSKQKSLVLTLIVSAIIVATLLMPVSFGANYSPVIANLFGKSKVIFTAAKHLSNMFCEVFGTTVDVRLVSVIAHIFYISQLFLIISGTIYLCFSLITLSTKKTSKIFHLCSSIIKYLLIICIIALLLSTSIFLLNAIDGASFMLSLGNMLYLYILWSVMAIWLFVRAVRMDKYLKN